MVPYRNRLDVRAARLELAILSEEAEVEQRLRDEVFGPLGLGHTAILEEPRSSPDLAVRYGPDGQPLPFYGSDHGGGSAAFSCAHDLVRFGMFHMGADVPDPSPILCRRVTALTHIGQDLFDGLQYPGGSRLATFTDRAKGLFKTGV